MKKLILLFLLIFLFGTSVYSQTIWFNQTSGTTINLYSIFFIDSSTGFIVGDSSKILKTTNGGLNWITQYAGSFTYSKLNSVYFLDNNTGFIAGGTNEENFGSLILKTTNGGENWNRVFSNSSSNLKGIFFINANSGYAVGSNQPGSYKYIFKSINNGNSWSQQLYLANFEYFNSVYFTNINNGYVVGNFGKIYKTTNGGINWSGNTLPEYNLSSVQFINDTVGYISSSGGKIFKTLNSGNNWTSINVLGISDELNSLYFTSMNEGYAVGTGSTIVNTTDGGINWESQLSPSIENLKSVYFADGNTGYAVGDRGTIIKTTNGGGGILEPSIKLYPKILLEGIYNPFLNILSRKDTVTVYLRDAAVPYILRDSSKQVLDTLSYSNLFTFNNSLSSTYYIVAKHFNSIETWSKAGGKLLINNGTNYYYDFTSSKSQAYGNNLKLIGLKYTMYSGDVNRDGFINLTDLVEIYNNSVEFVTGYYLTNDLNADSVIDLTDITICYNNSINFIQIVKP
jgi:photosystem II stability/assembly factor-like uncharacterized protein